MANTTNPSSVAMAIATLLDTFGAASYQDVLSVTKNPDALTEINTYREFLKFFDGKIVGVILPDVAKRRVYTVIGPNIHSEEGGLDVYFTDPEGETEMQREVNGYSDRQLNGSTVRAFTNRTPTQLNHSRAPSEAMMLALHLWKPKLERFEIFQ